MEEEAVSETGPSPDPLRLCDGVANPEIAVVLDPPSSLLASLSHPSSPLPSSPPPPDLRMAVEEFEAAVESSQLEATLLPTMNVPAALLKPIVEDAQPTRAEADIDDLWDEAMALPEVVEEAAALEPPQPPQPPESPTPLESPAPLQVQEAVVLEAPEQEARESPQPVLDGSQETAPIPTRSPPRLQLDPLVSESDPEEEDETKSLAALLPEEAQPLDPLAPVQSLPDEAPRSEPEPEPKPSHPTVSDGLWPFEMFHNEVPPSDSSDSSDTSDTDPPKSVEDIVFEFEAIAVGRASSSPIPIPSPSVSAAEQPFCLPSLVPPARGLRRKGGPPPEVLLERTEVVA